MVRVGIIGMGYRIGIAKMHIIGYQSVKDCVITALYDIDKANCEDYKQKFALKDAKVCDSLEELFSLVDAVSICTPNFTHVDIARKALEHHLNVLCEKPFAPHAAMCEELVSLAKKSDKVDMIGLCYRGIPAFRLLKDYADKGFFGKVYYIRSCQGGGRIASLDVKREWRMTYEKSGPGAMADFGSHEVDIIDGIFRPEIGKYKEVQAMSTIRIPERMSETTGKMEKVDNDDVSAFNIMTDKGVVVSFTASRIGSSHQVEVFGETGYAFFDGSRPMELVVASKKPSDGANWKKETVKTPDAYNEVNGVVPEVAFTINFTRQIEEFISAIEEHRKTEIDFSRGLYIQKILDAIEESAKEKKTVEIKG